MDVSIDQQQAMEERGFDYYEARARDVKLEEITSCNGNAEILRKLRDQDTSLKVLIISDHIYTDQYLRCFVIGEGNNTGWLGYFIGKSKYLEKLRISWGEGENIEALIEGINRNRSINSLYIGTNLGGLTSFQNLIPFFRNNNSLTRLELNSFEVGLECAQSFAVVLDESQCQSLKRITIEDCNLSDGGFAVISTALRSYPQLRDLYLENNNIGLMGCTALADTLRGWGTSYLKILDLDNNDIDDQGLEVLAAGLTNSTLEALYLSGNLITAVGLRSLSDYFQSDSCCLNTLDLYRVNFGDEGAVALADALMGNKSLTSLAFSSVESGITVDVGWAAFSKLLCDTSNVNNIYLSNHTIERIGGDSDDANPFDIRQYLELNVHLYPAIHKILRSHSDLDMETFFRWKLKLLPVVISWFRSARTCLSPNIGLRESLQRQSLQSRELSALYKFVRGMPSLVVTSYWQQLLANVQTKRLWLDEERRKLDFDEEAARERLGCRPRSEGSSDLVSGAKRRRQV